MDFKFHQWVLVVIFIVFTAHGCAWLMTVAKADREVMLCGVALVIDALKKYNEICMESVDIDGVTLLYCENEITGTWSVIKTTQHWTCIISVGRDTRPRT